MISGNRNAKKLDKLVNFFSKKIIVVSEAVKHQMINSESMNTGKIKTISLGYNFDLYDKPFENNLKDLKSKVNSSFIAIIISRMNENKRHILAFNAINRLVKENYNIKLIVLDTGPKENELKEYVKTENLVDRIIFTGFLNNTIDYLAISNVLIHPSISEASNQVVKEAAMLEIPSIVCHNVGDFDEYIVDKINGFLVNKLNPEDCIYNILKDYYSKKNELKKMGVSIKKDVLKSFNIDNVSDKYLNLSNES
jgi:glycosyltransferase involved in cell wall biosynthesis